MTRWLGNVGFSYIGLLYLLLLIVPGILWARRRPEGYDSSGENKILRIFERVGQALCTASLLIFSDYNPRALDLWLVWLFISAALMGLYIVYWIRYFGSPRTLRDFYRPLLGVPVPGAALPVLAFVLLGIYGRVIWMIVSAVVFGIGHIGNHWGHTKKINW
ncbi:MAG: hypothetical protein FWF10_01940 [Clostridiales bacterium]|nr:hypothetical protein [Clostridiales bacterium]